MSDIKGVISNAASAFWEGFNKTFPEVTSGDTQLSGEVEAAIGIWLTGDPGDEPVMTGRHYSADFFPSQSRIDAAVGAGIVEAWKVVLEERPELVSRVTPPEVFEQLKGCVREVLYWNYPRNKDGESADDFYSESFPEGTSAYSITPSSEELASALSALVEGVENWSDPKLSDAYAKAKHTLFRMDDARRLAVLEVYTRGEMDAVVGKIIAAGYQGENVSLVLDALNEIFPGEDIAVFCEYDPACETAKCVALLEGQCDLAYTAETLFMPKSGG